MRVKSVPKAPEIPPVYREVETSAEAPEHRDEPLDYMTGAYGFTGIASQGGRSKTVTNTMQSVLIEQDSLEGENETKRSNRERERK